LIPNNGKVGSSAIFSISNTPFPFNGTYYIVWSTTSKFEEGQTTVVGTGTVYRAYAVAARFTIPEVKAGMYFVEFNVAGDEPSMLPFTVKPGIVLTPSSARTGDIITVSGTGFSAGDRGSVTLDGGLSTVSFTANDKGSFSIQFPIPETTTGSHSMRASSQALGSDATSEVLQVTGKNNLTTLITTQPSTPIITPTPPAAPTGNPTAPPTVNPSGNVPASNQIGSKLSQPVKPAIISPRNESIGWFGSQPVSFKWSAQSGSSAVKYKLEIGSDPNFTSKISKSDITDTSYTLNVPSGTYWWRVKTVDSNGNESDWAYSQYTFSVGSFPGLPLIIGGLILVIILLFWMRARNNRQRQQQYYGGGYYYY
jgi:hypothetical protein